MLISINKNYIRFKLHNILSQQCGTVLIYNARDLMYPVQVGGNAGETRWRH